MIERDAALWLLMEAQMKRWLAVAGFAGVLIALPAHGQI
jgi:hypothetical protein